MTAYLLNGALCSILFNLICNMTTFWKRYSLTFWPHPLGQECSCGQNICYHVAASVVSFNLICNITIFWKSLILAWPHPLSPSYGLGLRPSTEIAFDMFHIYCCSACMQSFSKNINNCLSYCKIWIFDLWPLRWGQRGWGKTLTLPCLTIGICQSWSIVRSC